MTCSLFVPVLLFVIHPSAAFGGRNAGDGVPYEDLCRDTKRRTGFDFPCHCEAEGRGNLLERRTNPTASPGDCHVGLCPPRNDSGNFDLVLLSMVRSGHPGRGVPTRVYVGNGLRAVPPGAPKVCHPERRAKPEVEGSSHRMAFAQTVSAKILRLALLAQDDIVGTAVSRLHMGGRLAAAHAHAKEPAQKENTSLRGPQARGDRRECLWCNPVDFAGTTNGRLRSIWGIATSLRSSQ